jgi:hypothetical protein
VVEVFRGAFGAGLAEDLEKKHVLFGRAGQRVGGREEATALAPRLGFERPQLLLLIILLLLLILPLLILLLP